MHVLLVCLSFALQTSQPSPTVEHSAWDALLKQVVRDEKVDYVAIRDRHRDKLRAYLEAMAKIDPAALSREEKLALFINLYNAWMIELVVDRYRPDFSAQESKGAIWDEAKVRLGDGRTVSLNTLEHQLIRKELADPRIHAALVCAAISCPPLSRDAYTGDRIDEQLNLAMRNWINDPQRNVIDAKNRQLRLSKIFRWYATDFGGTLNLPEYLSKYTGTDIRGFDVTFLQYDWRLNDLSSAGRQ